MPIGAVVLDIGGVLEVNPRTGWQDRWAARLGLRNLEELLDPIWSDGAIGAATLGEVERRASAALHVDRATVAEMMEDAWEEYAGTLNGELAEYFRLLRSRYKTAMLSNSFVGAREREQDRYGFEDMCDGCRRSGSPIPGKRSPTSRPLFDVDPGMRGKCRTDR